MDAILTDMSRDSDRTYADVGRPSMPPERLLRPQLLQIFHSIRKERLQWPGRPGGNTFEGGLVRRIPKPLVVLLLTTAAVIVPPRVTATPRQETLSRDKAIFLMRLILGLEFQPPNGKTYVNLVDLLRTPGWPDAADRQQDGLPDIHVIDSSSGEALNYVVQVTTSDDKKHFQASLEPIDPTTCLPGFFTDDRGVIYVGKGLGCPAK